MEGRGPLVRDLTRRLRGADFRQALKAVAELRHLDRAVGAHVISRGGVAQFETTV